MIAPFQNNPKLRSERVSELAKAIRLTYPYDKLDYHDNGFFIGFENRDGQKRHYKISTEGEVLVVSDNFEEIWIRKDLYFPDLIFSARSGKTEYYNSRLYGLIDQNFNTTLAAIYQNLYLEEEGWIRVWLDDRTGAMNGFYQFVVPIEYLWIERNHGNGDFLCRKESGWDVFDENGNLLFSSEFTELICFGRTGYMTFSAKLNVRQSHFYRYEVFETDNPDQYETPYSYMDIDGKYGLLDANGKERIPCIYDMISPGYYSRDSLFIMVGELQKKDLTYEPEYNKYASYTTATGGVWGVLSYSNTLIIPPMYEWIESTRCGNGFLVNKGGIMTYTRWDHEDDIWDVVGGKWGLVSLDNEILVPIEYDLIWNYDRILFQYGDHGDFDLKKPYFEYIINNSNNED